MEQDCENICTISLERFCNYINNQMIIRIVQLCDLQLSPLLRIQTKTNCIKL